MEMSNSVNGITSLEPSIGRLQRELSPLGLPSVLSLGKRFGLRIMNSRFCLINPHAIANLLSAFTFSIEAHRSGVSRWGFWDYFHKV